LQETLAAMSGMLNALLDINHQSRRGVIQPGDIPDRRRA